MSKSLKYLKIINILLDNWWQSFIIPFCIDLSDAHIMRCSRCSVMLYQFYLYYSR